MSKTKQAAQAAANNSDAELRSVRLYLSPYYHVALRQLAARAEMPMSQWVRELVEREIDRRGNQL